MKTRGWFCPVVLYCPECFIVFECLETLVKHETRAYEMTSQSTIVLRFELRIV